MAANINMIPRRPPNPAMPAQGQPRNLSQLQARQGQLQARKDQLMAGGRKATPKLDMRLQQVGNRINRLTPPPPQTGGGLEYSGVSNQPGQIPEGQNPLTGDAMNPDNGGVMPNTRMFEPQDYAGSPLYQFQKDEGMKSLERLMAARGLTKSGAEIEANSKFLNQLGAQESNRQTEIAQAEADRLERMQQQEADRRQQAGDTAFERFYKMTELASRQSPMDQAYNAAGRGADMTNEYGRRRGGQVAGNYRRRSGGGGRGAPVYAPPFPSGPDYSGSNILDKIGAGGIQNPWLGSLPYLFAQ